MTKYSHLWQSCCHVFKVRIKQNLYQACHLMTGQKNFRPIYEICISIWMQVQSCYNYMQINWIILSIYFLLFNYIVHYLTNILTCTLLGTEENMCTLGSNIFLGGNGQGYSNNFWVEKVEYLEILYYSEMIWDFKRKE